MNPRFLLPVDGTPVERDPVQLGRDRHRLES